MPLGDRVACFSYQDCTCRSITSLQGSDGQPIAIKEVHELLSKIHDNLYNDIPSLVGSTAHILTYILNAACRQHCEVWTSQISFLYSFTSQISFLYSFKDAVSTSEICLYGRINWSVAQAEQQPFLALPSLLPL